MTLRKITIDYSVKCIVKNNHSHVSNDRDKTKKNVSNNKLSQKNKKINNNISAEGFRIIQRTANC